jgi:hypothetical protein
MGTAIDLLVCGTLVAVLGVALTVVGLTKNFREHGFGNARFYGRPGRAWTVAGSLILLGDLVGVLLWTGAISPST